MAAAPVMLNSIHNNDNNTLITLLIATSDTRLIHKPNVEAWRLTTFLLVI